MHRFFKLQMHTDIRDTYKELKHKLDMEKIEQEEVILEIPIRN